MGGLNPLNPPLNPPLGSRFHGVPMITFIIEIRKIKIYILFLFTLILTAPKPVFFPFFLRMAMKVRWSSGICDELICSFYGAFILDWIGMRA